MKKPREFETHPVRFLQARSEGLTRGVVKWCNDGDTIGIFVDLGYYQYGLIELRLRVDNSDPSLQMLDTPEIVGAEKVWAEKAKALLEANALDAPVILRADLTRTDRERKTFERFVGPCWRVVTDSPFRQDLGLLMRQAGFDKLHPL